VLAKISHRITMKINCYTQITCLTVLLSMPVLASDSAIDWSASPAEKQLPGTMHSSMSSQPQISVGVKDCDIVGTDNRALQAAVDYIAALGGGTVIIGPGEYTMRDSLHLRSNVTVKGTQGQTVLRKAKAAVSPLGLDGDFGEQQITVKDTTGFDVGYGVTIRDDRAGGFHTTVAIITGRTGNTFSIDKPIMADCMVDNNARAATVFPVVSGYHIDSASIEDVTIDGAKDTNIHLNGCRGAGIFLYRAHGTVISGCLVEDYNGDGISFQQSNDVKVIGCVSQNNAKLGLHPGSGSQRPVLKNCVAQQNGSDGLFLCWRVRHGLFENNVLKQNGRFGISIGHKDSDNMLRNNVIMANGDSGIFFRNESLSMAPHRNRLENNVIENNGTKKPSPGIRIRGAAKDLVFINNIIRDTREKQDQSQTVGLLIEGQVGKVTLKNNQILCAEKIKDLRKGAEIE